MLRLTLTVIFILLLFQVSGQQFLTLPDERGTKPDYNVISENQKVYLTALYLREVDKSDELINGREYVPYYFRSIITPLLSGNRKHSGFLIFNNRQYKNVTLDYDTYHDQLIYSDSSKLIEDKQFKIALNKDLVGGFTLFFKDDSMKFRYFRADGPGKFNLSDGFYEVVYDGKTKCIIRHQSFLAYKDGVEEYRYEPAEYILVGQVFTRVKSSKSFISLFGKDADKVRKFLRTNRIHFRRAGKNEIATVLRYVDTSVISSK